VSAGQRDVCRHRAEGDRVVPDTGKVEVGGPVAGDQLGLRGDGAEHEGLKFLLAKALDHLEPDAPCVPPSISTAPATGILPTPLRPAGTTTGSFLGAERDDRLVGLDQAADRLALGVDHSPAQHASKLPLTIEFWAAFLMATHSNGISVRQLQSQLSLGSYRTAWMLAAKPSAVSNLKRWGLGVYRGLRKTNLQHYLDEFVFRFNRRRTPMPPSIPCSASAPAQPRPPAAY
jgi:ISXO2-like transposase domain